MAVTAEWTRYGRPAAERLRAELGRCKAGEALAPVTVIVASNHVGVATRRMLASGALGPVTGQGIGMAGVTFLTVYRLAELLGAAPLAGSGRRPVSTPVIAAALRTVLADDAGLFSPVATHPATEEALVRAYRELRDLPESALDRLAGTGERAAAVIGIHRAARRRLVADWYDEEDLMASAAEVVALGRAEALLAPTILYLPQRLSSHAAGLLGALGRQVPTLVLAGATGDARADAEVAAGLVGLGVSEPPPRSAPVSVGPFDPGRIGIVTVSDADEEVRVALRSVADAVRAGVPLGRIAVFHTTAEPYARLLHDQLAAAGFPANGTSIVPLARSLAGRTLLQLLDWPERGYRRWDLFAWLSGSPVRHAGGPAPASGWERLSRQAAVVAGGEDWDQRLDGYASGREDEAARCAADPEQPGWRAEQAREEARRARALREFALGLIAELTAAAEGPRAWASHAGWARRLLGELLAEPAARDEWPAAEVKAAERVDEAIDRLSTLDGIEGPVGLAVFTRTLRLVLEADPGRVGRLGEGVAVGSLAMGVGLDLDLVVVVGLAEGSAPPAIGEDPLFSDVERSAVKGQLIRGRDRVDRQHRELLAGLAGAARAVLTVPRGDLRTSSERVPSRWVLDVASALAGRSCNSADLDRMAEPWLTAVASFDAGVRTAPTPATAQEHHLRRLMAQPDPGAGLAGDGDRELVRAVEVVTARRSGDFTRFDGNLAGSAIVSPTSRPTSATRLEAWTACPFSHFLQYVLGVEPVEDPDERLRISPLDKGDLIHAALEQFFAAHLSDEAETWDDDHHSEPRAIAETLCAGYEAKGLTGRSLLWESDRMGLLADLDQTLRADAELRRRTGQRPIAVELAFGIDDTAAPVGLALPDGRRVLLRGRADRVDLAPGGVLAVIDYKSGKAERFKKLRVDDPTLSGAKLQLPVYALAARARHGKPNAVVQADYWFVTRAARFARYGYAVDDDVLARTAAVLATIVEGIEAGAFPARPDPSTTNPMWGCRYCDPDALGTGDLRRAWERKATDPALAGYVALVEPGLAEQEVGHGAP